jgi:hypothetical protein
MVLDTEGMVLDIEGEWSIGRSAVTEFQLINDPIRLRLDS